MNENIGKAIIGGIGAALIILVKTCAKNADTLVRHADNALPHVTDAISHTAPRTARVIAKQYLSEDNPKGDMSYESWTEADYKNYFLADLGKVKSQLKNLSLSDTTYTYKINRDYRWLTDYYIKTDSSFNDLLIIAKDTTKPDLKTGAVYLFRLIIAKSFLTDNRFDNLMIDKPTKSLLASLKKGLPKKGINREKELKRIILVMQEHFHSKFYPYHKDIAEKAIHDYVLN